MGGAGFPEAVEGVLDFGADLVETAAVEPFGYGEGVADIFYTFVPVGPVRLVVVKAEAFDVFLGGVAAAEETFEVVPW